MRGHKKGLDYRTRGNNLANKEAQEAALRTQVAKINVVRTEEDTSEEKQLIGLSKKYK